MTDKYTPGPWQQAHRQRHDGMYATEVFDAHGVIAVIDWYPVTHPDGSSTSTARDANARLIAASPELLNALEALQADTRLALGGTHRKRIAAAIANAKGWP